MLLLFLTGTGLPKERNQRVIAPQVVRPDDEEDEVLLIISSLFTAHRRVSSGKSFDDRGNINERNQNE
tara:strand:- start:143 stop:346 length:204 start_codon:yes stop_codon:yes gene_type:complete